MARQVSIDSQKRQSMLGMDQVAPAQGSSMGFGLGPVQESEEPIKVSATADPLDVEFTIASDSLSAATHAEKERQNVFNTILMEQTWELATKNSNPAIDLVICLERHRTIGFRYVDVQRKIVITHGSEDKRVPVENVRWLADQINPRTPNHLPISEKEREDDIRRAGCEIKIIPGEGHGLMANAMVMSDVLTDIAREWKKSSNFDFGF